MKENESVKKYLAEFIGTFVLVLFACGTACVLGCDTRAGYLAVALSFGLVIVAMAYSIGNISGCHINPAVSFAMFLSKKMTLEDFIGYVIAQFLGATAGAGVLAYLVGKGSGLGINTIANVGWGKSFVIEVILLQLGRRHRHRSCADAGSPSRHQVHRHFRQPRPQLRSLRYRRRRSAQGSVGLHRGSAGGRRSRGCLLQIPRRQAGQVTSCPASPDFHQMIK